MPVWLDPTNRDAHFMALLSRSVYAVDPKFEVITTARAGADMGPVPVRAFYSEIPCLPVGRIGFYTRVRMLTQYYQAFRKSVAEMDRGTTVLYSSELPFRALEIAALQTLKSRVRKVVRLVHNVDRTSHIHGLFDDHIFLSETERRRGVEVMKLPLVTAHVVLIPHFGTIMADVEPDPAVAALIRHRARGRRVLAFISRANREHGIDLFYRLLAESRALELPVCGVVIGRADQSWGLSQESELRKRLELDDVLVWSQTDPYTSQELKAVTQAADAVIAPYRKVSQSAAIALALGEKVPVLASDVGANRELVRDGVDGTLFDPADQSATQYLLSSIYRDGAGARTRYPPEPIGDHLDPTVAAEKLLTVLRA